MPVAVDYYSILGIPRSAGEDQITDAIKKSMREWRKRTDSHDLGVRQESETMIKRLQEARETLLNAGRRRDYDARLAAEGVAQTEPGAPGAAGTDWLDRAKQYLARGDYHSAAYAAREATQTAGGSAESWWIRSRANAGIGRLDDAVYEAQQSVQLEQSKAEYHFHLGCVNEELGRWTPALQEFERASQLDRTIPMYQLAVGGVYLSNGLPDKALAIIEPVYRAHPDDENAGFYLASALVDCAEQVPRLKNDTSYVVTTAEEIARMREYTRRASAIKNLTPEVRSGIRDVTGYLDRMSAKKFSPPIGGLMPSSCVGVLLFIAVALAPVWLVIGGFSVIGGGESIGGGLLMIMIGAALGYLWFRLSWVPNWKVNARIHR